MNRFLSILAILATLTVIVFTSLDRREGLLHKTEKSAPQPTEPAVATVDTIVIDSLKIEIEQLVDTTNINI